MQAFVEQYFEEPGAELVPYTPVDCPASAPLREHVVDVALREFLDALHALWPTLCRTVAPEVAQSPQRYSALPRRSPVVLPGGRFRETYYWDSLWIVEGLLASGMRETARGLVQNLLDDVERFGFVPNGGRIYYLNRSQPPLLCEMVASVARALDAAAASAWMSSAVPLLQKEHGWWMSGTRAVCVGDHVLNRFFADWYAPRPESYREDLETGQGNASVYQNMASGAESGWDYSCRWTRSGGTHGGEFSLRETATSSVLPVDLNVILYRAELTLAALVEATATGQALRDVEAGFAAGTGYTDSTAASFAAAAKRRQLALEEVLWQPGLGRWVDAWLPEGYESGTKLDLKAVDLTNAAERSPTLADFAGPLWAGLGASRGEAVVHALKASNLLNLSGAQTTVQTTGQQWDAPNAWPPLQAMLIEGLRSLDPSSGGPDLARSYAQKWVGTCYASWRRTGFMHEKYDATKFGVGGAGGEYEPQVGFGWSNGVVLQLLRDYGQELEAPAVE
eukprot:TRINITY_DN60601_c0_g1_i1.p1 TRINITY_DN60601_c0_g1~~TRINITY_DN60601_c0_g1_i1.p1  ORF type:complete len:586 (+),score=122.91 TRINITY_DN60601_c0_g1_i1:239-1759(+)